VSQRNCGHGLCRCRRRRRRYPQRYHRRRRRSSSPRCGSRGRGACWHIFREPR
jgi:hypothetical protein